MRLSALVFALAFAAAGCAAPSTVEVAGTGGSTDPPTPSVSPNPAADTVAQLVSGAWSGSTSPEQAPADAFHPAMLVGPGSGQTGQPLPAGRAQFWDGADEGPNPCWLYDEDDVELEDCERHHGERAPAEKQ